MIRYVVVISLLLVVIVVGTGCSGELTDFIADPVSYSQGIAVPEWVVAVVLEMSGVSPHADVDPLAERTIISRYRQGVVFACLEYNKALLRKTDPLCRLRAWFSDIYGGRGSFGSYEDAAGRLGAFVWIHQHGAGERVDEILGNAYQCIVFRMQKEERGKGRSSASTNSVGHVR
ncbi:MAG: hypothetical protein JXD19_08335 [Deltaproteobacteria bacterium]|nr:hypothetical protein [Deltaproteobacteria bacterium]